MGNQAGSLNYSVGKAIDCGRASTYWQLFEATKKDDKPVDSEVTIFKFMKSQADKINPVQRGVQKLRTIKHPYILSYIDSSITDESVLLVTEPCIPLSVWLRSVSDEPGELQAQLNNALWGFRCVIQAIEFLHSKCTIGHNSIGTHSIFVVKNGDWKLGMMDFAGNPANSGDMQFLQENVRSIPSDFLPSDIGRSNSFPNSLTEVDMFSVGKAMEIVFDRFSSSNDAISDNLRKLVQRLVHSDPKRRATISQLLRAPDFNSDSIQLFVDLGDVSLKSITEAVDILKKINGRSKQIPSAICLYKILPIISDKLRIAATDFQNRDLREQSRMMIDVCVEIIASFADNDKITEANFPSSTCDVLAQIWQLSDRSIRNALLRTCKSIIPLIPSVVVNKSVFEPMLAGFADSNAKMREETLKNLIHVVEKLDEKQLQERLVRCVLNLQSDAEKSIRTNATIFLGRIAPKLKETTRNRVLAQAFTKAMKDPFVHCRVAGVKAAQASLSLVDPTQVSTALMPHACALLIDGSPEVRQLAHALLESSLKIMSQVHATMLATSQAQDAQSPSGGNSTPTKSDGSAWTSWAVGELSKTIEKVSMDAIMSPQQQQQQQGGLNSHIGNLPNQTQKFASNKATNNQNHKENSYSKSSMYENNSSDTHNKASKSSNNSLALDNDDDDDMGVKPNQQDNDNGWDDDINWSDDESDKGNKSTSTSDAKRAVSQSSSTSSTAPKGMSLKLPQGKDEALSSDAFFKVSATSTAASNTNTSTQSASVSASLGLGSSTSSSSSTAAAGGRYNLSAVSTASAASTLATFQSSNNNATTNNAKAAKPVAKKLSVKSDENWDDF